MDSKTLSSLHDVFKEVQKQQDWKAALDKLFASLRGDFVFDNVVIYFMEPHLKSMDVLYARAMGRGKGLEADVSWGENFAHDVITKGKMVSKEPLKNIRVFDRLTQAYLLGFPISAHARKKGAIVFVRFCWSARSAYPQRLVDPWRRLAGRNGCERVVSNLSHPQDVAG